MSQATPASEVRHCIKCGREVGPDETICAVCNRAGMSTPSASQYHGTVAVAIIVAVAALAIAASLSMRGIGPYAAEVRRVTPREPVGFDITLAVTNQGTNAGRGKCQVVALDADGRRLRVASTVTERIEGGATREASVSLPGLAEEPDSITVSCS